MSYKASRVPNLSRFRRWTAPLAYLVLTVYFTWPLLASGDAAGGGDWDQHLFYYASVFKSVYEYGQAPFWNPWYCGGNVLWQNPQVAILSPVYLLAPFLSIPLAMKITIALHYLVGLIGMHLLLTRSVRLTFLPAVIFCASMFALAGGHAVHLAAGHSVFLPVFYLPLQVHFFLQAVEHRRWRPLFYASGLMALSIWNGGFHGVELSVVVVALLAVTLSVARRDWAPLALAAGIGVMSGLYAAPRLLPIGLFVSNERFWDTRPPTVHPDAMSVDMVARAYLDPAPVRGFAYAAQRHLWHEYANHIGAFGAILFLASCAWIAWRAGGGERRWLGVSIAATAVLLLLISAGEYGAWAPYSLMRRLPLISNFRVPSRHTLAFVLLAAAAAGFALAEAARETDARKDARALLALVFVMATLHLATVNRAVFAGVFRRAPLAGAFHALGRPPAPAEDLSGDVYTGDAPMLRAVVENRAFLHCYEPLQIANTYAAGRPLVFTDSEAALTGVTFTPNRIEFAVVPRSRTASVALNQNFIDGWRSTAGDVMRSGAVEISTPGRYTFWFVPPGLMAGSVLFLLGVAVTALAARGVAGR